MPCTNRGPGPRYCIQLAAAICCIYWNHRNNVLCLQTPAFETYLHRIGRSGRFGRKGAAFNLVTGDAVSGVISSL